MPRSRQNGGIPPMQPEDGGAELVCRGIVRASAEYVMMSITYEGTLR